MARYAYQPFPYRTAPELAGGVARRWPVVIVGAGPIGLSAAIDLALHEIPCLLLDDNDVVSRGSRAICWSKRTLEIFDRLGVAERMVKKGVTWKVGRLYHRDREVYAFDLLPEAGHKNPAFINLQQYYVEQFLVERCFEFPELIDLRFKNKVTAVRQTNDGVEAQVETPDGSYGIECDYLIACDGAKSSIRSMLGVEFKSHIFPEQFLITDVEMKADFPSERWFWFEPTFHNGQSALLHKQPDDIYRIDLQLTPQADPKEETKPENVIPRIKAAIGDRPFEIDWVSLYTFQCGRIDRFLHDRIIFAGDSAHVVSPFGARGGNGGIHDVDNLVWKLAAVIKGGAPNALLESYNAERVHGADENIRNSSHSTNFMTPKNSFEHMLRDEVLALAETYPFARRLVNSGRLSVPCSLAGFALQSLDDPGMTGPMTPGTACLDAPVRDATGHPGWLLDHLGGEFVVMSFGMPASVRQDVRSIVIASEPVAGVETLCDETGLIAQRYGGHNGAAYLIRPDQHVAARFAHPTADKIAIALARARAEVT
ncbi:MAG: FAD-dependent oxidoreductase [Proteobacteria bacterium]|nr:MAG: FAD-dependent oxidoreductase [Pseudomonadota bacterium]